MKFFVISGGPNKGKTTTINKIAQWLTTNTNIQSLPTFLPNNNGIYQDFSIVINIKGKKIIIHSATDDKSCMDNLIKVIKQNPDTEIVITSCRDIYWERTYFINNIKPFSSFFLESPLAEINRRKNFTTAYNSYIDILFQMHQHILSNTPYNL